ncbi:hypothetical protein OT109_07050 [Phycisphaeraceae bacterium D3-23]
MQGGAEMRNWIMMVLAALCVSGVARAQDAPPTAEDLGAVVALEFGVLYIPDTFAPDDAGQIDLLVHFHGGLDILARAIDTHGLNAVMVHVSPGGLSSSYRVPFEEDDALWGRLLDAALAHVRARDDVAGDADWRQVNLSSFSAGYGAVRELLKREDAVAQIDGIALCDTVYAGYVERDGANVPNPAQVAPFTAFARLAGDAESGKTLVMTHSYLEPGPYAGTHEVAQAVVDAVGADDRAADEEGPAGMRIVRRATLGRFEVFGVAGDDGPAHMVHLHTVGHWLAMLEWGAAEGAEGRRGRGAE